MHEQPRHRHLHVVDIRHGASGRHDSSAIAQLSARLRVEGRAIKDDLQMLACGCRRNRDTIAHQPDDAGLGVDLGVAGETRAATRFEDVAVGRGGRQADLAFARISLRTLALLAHQGAEALLVDLQSLLCRHLKGEVDGKAVCVMQRERLLP